MADTNLKLIIEASVGQAKTAVKDLQSQLDTFSDTAQKTNKELKTQKADLGALQSVYTKTAAVAGALTVAGVGLITMFAKQAAQAESTKTSFSAMLGSVEKGEKLFKDLANFAKTTPFEFPELQESTKRLLAYGIAQEEVIKTLGTLGDIASGVGMEKMPQLITAFGQVRAATVLTGMELRQLTETGVPIIEELAKVTGYSAKQITSDTKSLGISFETVKQALENMTNEGGKFHNMMMMQSQTLSGMWSNFKDALGLTIAEIGTALLPMLKQLLGFVLSVVNGLQQFAQANPEIMKVIGVLTVMGTVVAGLITGYALFAKLLISTVVPALTGTNIAVSTLNKQILALFAPIIPAITPIIIALGALYLAWRTNFLFIRDIVDNAVKFIRLSFAIISTALSATMSVVKMFSWIFSDAMDRMASDADLRAGEAEGYLQRFTTSLSSMAGVIKVLLAEDLNSAWAAVPNGARQHMYEALYVIQDVSNMARRAINLLIQALFSIIPGFAFLPKELKSKVMPQLDILTDWAETTQMELMKLPPALEEIEDGLGGGGGGGGLSGAVKDTAKDFAKFAKDIERQAESISKKYADLKKDIQELKKATAEELGSNRMNLAESFVEAEERMKELKQERRDLEKDLANEENEDQRKRLQEELDEVKDKLRQEANALEAVSGIKGEISKELSEARKIAAMSELERAVYFYEQEKKKIQEVHNDKLAKIKEELEEVKKQREEMVALVEGKNAELKKLYADDTHYYAKELDAQVLLLEQTKREMIEMYNEIAMAKANALGGKANLVTPKVSGRRATGGYVAGGSTYMVGERGAELFTPQRSGYILPNNQVGGGSIIINFNGDVLDADELARRLNDLTVQDLKLSNRFV